MDYSYPGSMLLLPIGSFSLPLWGVQPRGNPRGRHDRPNAMTKVRAFSDLNRYLSNGRTPLSSLNCDRQKGGVGGTSRWGRGEQGTCGARGVTK